MHLFRSYFGNKLNFFLSATEILLIILYCAHVFFLNFHYIVNKSVSQKKNISSIA